MNPIISYLARRADRLMSLCEFDGESFWLFNPINEYGRRRYPFIPLSVRFLELYEGPSIDLSSRGELFYVLRGWLIARHSTGIAYHYSRYKEGDRVLRRRWDGIQFTSTSSRLRQQTLCLGLIYGF